MYPTLFLCVLLILLACDSSQAEAEAPSRKSPVAPAGTSEAPAHLEDPIEDRTYTSSGGSHVHTFTVSASQLEELRDTCSLTLETSLPHAHTWAVEIL